jgi:hypothetical protein
VACHVAGANHGGGQGVFSLQSNIGVDLQFF